MPDTATTGRHPAAIRKAAILITTLDTATADALLDKMPEEQAARVRQAVMVLDDILPHEQDAVIREFMGGEAPTANNELDGVELNVSLAAKLQSADGYPPARPSTGHIAAPFHSLFQAGVSAVVRQLEQQHPQVTAIVVAHLAPQRAAEVVQRLSPRLQADVLRRVAELDATDAEVIRDIEQGLEQLLNGAIHTARLRHAGMTTVAAIVNAAGIHRAGLLGNLTQHHQELADELAEMARPEPGRLSEKKQLGELPPDHSHAAGELAGADSAKTTRRSTPDTGSAAASTAKVSAPTAARHTSRAAADFSSSRNVDSTKSDRPQSTPTNPTDQRLPTFDELADLRDDEWVKLIQSVDAQVLLVALTGAGEFLVERITGQLPRHEARQLRRRLEQIGPVQLADIDRAQRHIVQQAVSLASNGILQLPRRRNFAAAA